MEIIFNIIIIEFGHNRAYSTQNNGNRHKIVLHSGPLQYEQEMWHSFRFSDDYKIFFRVHQLCPLQFVDMYRR